MLGRVLDGRWVIESRIGTGGMGAVYLAHQQSVNRKVAIKTLRPALAESDNFVERFFQEVKVTATFNHPHSVTIHDFGQAEDGMLYLVMEYLEGQPLTDRAEDGSMTMEEILKVGMQIASALSAAHDAKIVHRDLKPDNIFLLDIPGGGTFVKVLDFGIAKVLDADTKMTQTGQIFGTPQYMSPEQCQGHVVDGRSDLYSLGCILYELVGGRPPFGGETPMAVLMGHVVSPVPPLRDKFGESLDPRLEAEVMALLAKDPDDRPATAGEARQRLEAVLSAMSADQLRHTASQLAVKAPTGAPLQKRQTKDLLSTIGTPPPDDVEPRETGLTESIALEAGLGTSKNRMLLIAAALLSVALLGAVGVIVAIMGKDDDAVDAIAVLDDEPPPVEATAEEPEEDIIGPAMAAEAESKAKSAIYEAEKIAAVLLALKEQEEALRKEAAAAAQRSSSSRTRRQSSSTRRPSAPATKTTTPRRSEPPPAPKAPTIKAPEDDPFDFFSHD